MIVLLTFDSCFCIVVKTGKALLLYFEIVAHSSLLRMYMLYLQMKVIARIHKLELYNGSKISSRERVDCERRYLSIITGELAKEDDSHAEAKVLAVHPRYQSLLDIHGEIW